MNWKNTYRGFMMGISDVIPGVSGGTIAVLLGIYDDFIASMDIYKALEKTCAFSYTTSTRYGHCPVSI